MRALLLAVLVAAVPAAGASAAGCGEVVQVATHGTTTRYALTARPGAPAALMLLVGGGGILELDNAGCPRALSHNVLIRMMPFFQEAGLVTALVDAPSDVHGEDGLAGFRLASQHAEDLGKIIADLRARTGAPVWMLGHSRGTISAANAAARLKGTAAPDGVVLLSAMMVGDASKKRPFVAQTVFDAPLDAITIPILAIGHEADSCVRSPARRLGSLVARTRSVRPESAVVAGGPVAPGRAPSVGDCGVGDPHDFVAQEAELAAGILRFVGGGTF
jgi:hypothetical protein